MYINDVHAPHQTHGLKFCIDWWNDMYEIFIDHVPDLSKHLSLGDFSIKSGATQSSAIGSCPPDKEAKVGKHEHSLLLKLDLAIPSSLFLIILSFLLLSHLLIFLVPNTELTSLLFPELS